MTPAQEILDSYRRFDGLNMDSAHPTVKILVSYIKPSFLFKSEILTPIHLGRAVERDPSKDGVPDDRSIEWLHANCLGDDDFEGHLSCLNRRVGFLTGTYWAWRNYGRLGNPEFFGSFGYRRLLSPDALAHLDELDLVLPKLRHLNLETVEQQAIRAHGLEMAGLMRNVFTEGTCDAVAFNRYLDGTAGYFDELYIMRRSFFFDFCDWMFPLLRRLVKIAPKKRTASVELRDIGFVVERLTGFYLSRLKDQLGSRTIEVDTLVTESMSIDRKALSQDVLSLLRNQVKR